MPINAHPGLKFGWPLVLLLALAAIAVSAIAGQLSSNFVVGQIKSEAGDRLTFYATRLESAVNKLRHLPIAVGEHPAVKSALLTPGQAQPANVYLETVNTAAGGEALYVLDRDGLTVAASNWKESFSFIGHNYGFRPYFQEALKGAEGFYFAVGATTGRPGVFISRPIADGDDTLGVAVIKIGLDGLKDGWDPANETILVSDGDGVVFLSTQPDWRYKMIRPVPRDRLEALIATRRYHSVELTSLDFASDTGSLSGRVELAGQEYLAVDKDLPFLEWRLHYLADLSPTFAARGVGMLVAGTLLLAGGLILLYLRERRMKLAHAKEAEEAAAVREANRLLESEISERRRVEENLRVTQKELIQAGKLAALGQMSAAIAHEVNQPITAIRTFVASGKLLLDKDRKPEVEDNLNQIGHLTERLAAITGQLKSFARKSPGVSAPVDVQACVSAAVELLEPQAKMDGTAIEIDLPPGPVVVQGDEVHVEQILINLLRNALDAVRDTGRREVTIRGRREDGDVVIQVRDSGPGMDLENLEQIFDPFFTTKTVGEGMGLGLTVSFTLAEEMKGQLVASNNEGGGACFSLTLPSHEISTQAAE